MSESLYHRSEYVRREPPNEFPRSSVNLKVRERSSFTQAEMDEAREWHHLFTEGWVTAHELKGVSKDAHPAREGELFKVETERLRALKEIIDADLSDEEFNQRLDE